MIQRRCVALALILMIGLAGRALAWDPPPPACTEAQVPDVAAATPTLSGVSRDQVIPLSPSGLVALEARSIEVETADPTLSTVPDLLLLEIRRTGGKVVRTYGDSIGIGEVGAEWEPPLVERSYVVGALAVFDLYGEAPCSLESDELSFHMIRRTIGPAQARGRILGMIGRLQKRLDSVSTGSGLSAAADGMSGELDDLAVLSLRSERATRALDAWITYARRFVATVDGLGEVLGQYRIPGPKAIARISVRAGELKRATGRLARELRRMKSS